MSALPCASARTRSCRRRGRHVRHAGKHAQLWSRNPNRKSASVWSSAYFPRPGLRISRKQRRLSALQPTLPVHRLPEAHPLRKESQRSKDSHEASNKRCPQTFLPRCQSSVPKRHRESQEDRIPRQAAIGMRLREKSMCYWVHGMIVHSLCVHHRRRPFGLRSSANLQIAHFALFRTN